MRSNTSSASLPLSPVFLSLNGEDDVFSSKLQGCPSFFDFFNPFYTWLNVSHVFHFGAMCLHENLKLLVLGPLPSGILLFLPLGIHLIFAMCSPTPHASKNVKFRLSQNSTKFDVVARFCETIPTVKSVSSSEI